MLSRLYRSDDPALWLRATIAAVNDLMPELVIEAASRIIREHQTAFAPAPGLVRSTALRVMGERRSRERQLEYARQRREAARNALPRDEARKMIGKLVSEIEATMKSPAGGKSLHDSSRSR